MYHVYKIAFLSIVKDEIRRFTRIWLQTLIPPVITTFLYFLIFGDIIGSRIGYMGNFRYMEYIMPGLIMMSIINNAYGNVSSSFFSAKFQRSIEEILIAPVPTIVIIISYVCGGMARGICVGILVSIVSLMFVNIPIAHPMIVIITVLLTTLMLSLAGLLNGIFARNFDDISIIPTFILTPLTYLGGVFYSIDLLSPFWQTLSHLNPIAYAISAFRYGYLGMSAIDVTHTIIVLFIINIILFATVYLSIEKGKKLRT